MSLQIYFFFLWFSDSSLNRRLNILGWHLSVNF